MKSFGELVRQKRKQLGYNQKDLAKAIGIGRSQMSNIETSQGSPSFMGGLELCAILEIDPMEIVREKALEKRHIHIDKQISELNDKIYHLRQQR